MNMLGAMAAATAGINNVRALGAIFWGISLRKECGGQSSGAPLCTNYFLVSAAFPEPRWCLGLWFWTMAVCKWIVLWFMLWVLACSMWK